MECGRLSPDAPTRPEDDQMATVEDEGKTSQMVACELEAAEALAGLARCSALNGRAPGSGELERELVPEEAATSTHHSQGKQEQRFSNKDKEIDTAVSNIKDGFERTDDKILRNTPSQLCSTSCRSNTNTNSNSATKLLRPILSEAEKEERKLRRVLANRESARQTIRRRQAMYLELTKKAADVTNENENLKKKKELAVEQYDSLKDRNGFLKAQLAKFKKTKPRQTQNEPKSSSLDKSCSATVPTPLYLHDPSSSAVPCFFPSFIPSLDVSQIQYASHSNIPHRTTPPPCPHHGQENPMGTTTPGTPLFVVPVPWLLSFLTNDNRQNIMCSCSETPLHENNKNTRAEASSSKKTMSMGPINCQVHDNCNVKGPEKTGHVLSEKRNEPIIRSTHKTAEDAFAASEARRRRKELMKLKDTHYNRGVYPRY